MATGLETEAGLAIGRGNAASLRRNSSIIPGFGNDEASAGTKDGREAGMREPPDQKRKTPPQHHPRQGQIRKQHHPNRSKALHSGQLPAYLPRRGSKSLQAVARQLRDDGLAPVRLRTFAVQVAHRLSVGGRVNLGDERLLRRLSAERRRQLAALLGMYS